MGSEENSPVYSNSVVIKQPSSCDLVSHRDASAKAEIGANPRVLIKQGVRSRFEFQPCHRQTI